MKLRWVAWFGCLVTCLAMGFVTHDAAAEALDVDSFKERVAQCVAKGRPQWSQEQRAGLAALIVSELRTKMGDRLHQTAASHVLDHLEHAVNRIGLGASSHAAAVAMTQEYFRWAIADYASRSDMTAEQIAELEKQIRDCFGEAVNTVGKEITSDLHERLGQSAAKHLEGTLRSMHDPPTNEMNSYEGLQTTNLALTSSSPVAWERKPYHENQRHVLFYDGHVELVPETRFQSLTNSPRATP